MTRADDQRIADILDAASELAAIVDLGAEWFRTDSILQRATERLLEIIGEAANALSADTKTHHPEVPWTDVTRLRIVLAHHYHRVAPSRCGSSPARRSLPSSERSKQRRKAARDAGYGCAFGTRACIGAPSTSPKRARFSSGQMLAITDRLWNVANLNESYGRCPELIVGVPVFDELLSFDDLAGLEAVDVEVSHLDRAV